MIDKDTVAKAIRLSEQEIDTAKATFKKLVEKEDWEAVSAHAAYIDGMEQILVMFKVVIDWYNLEKKEQDEN